MRNGGSPNGGSPSPTHKTACLTPQGAWKLWGVPDIGCNILATLDTFPGGERKRRPCFTVYFQAGRPL